MPKLIQVTMDNINNISYEDIVAVVYASGGAMGNGGELTIVQKRNTTTFYTTNLVYSADKTLVEKITNTYFKPFIEAFRDEQIPEFDSYELKSIDWIEIMMGFTGNYIFVKKNYYDKFKFVVEMFPNTYISDKYRLDNYLDIYVNRYSILYLAFEYDLTHYSKIYYKVKRMIGYYFVSKMKLYDKLTGKPIPASLCDEIYKDIVSRFSDCCGSTTTQLNHLFMSDFVSFFNHAKTKDFYCQMLTVNNFNNLFNDTPLDSDMLVDISVKGANCKNALDIVYDAIKNINFGRNNDVIFLISQNKKLDFKFSIKLFYGKYNS